MNLNDPKRKPSRKWNPPHINIKKLPKLKKIKLKKLKFKKPKLNKIKLKKIKFSGSIIKKPAVQKNAGSAAQTNAPLRKARSQTSKPAAAKRRKRRYRYDRIALLVLGAALIISLLGWGACAGGKALVRHFQKQEPAISWKLTRDEKESLETITCPENILPETFDAIRSSALDEESEWNKQDAWFLAHISEFDEDLLSFYLNDRDRADFVHEWPNRQAYQEPAASIGVALDEFPGLLQWDLAWGYQPYGESLIYIAGCAPTCMSMIASWLRQDETITPRVMSDLAIEYGDFYPGQGTGIEFFDHAAERYGLMVESSGTDPQWLRQILAEGKPVIFHMLPGTFTTIGHYIIGYGLDEEGKVLIKDPNSIARTNQTWALEDILAECGGSWAFSYPEPSAQTSSENSTMQSESHS